MLSKFYRLLWFIHNREYIPKLPRGMLASKYDEMDLTRDEWRVLDRIGARDPAGIKRAMKQHKVDNIQDLIAVLEHHKPRRRIRERLNTAIGRVVGGYKYDPHADDVKRAFKQYRENEQYIKIKERIKKAKQSYE